MDLDDDLATLIDEMIQAPPYFSGALDALGGSFVSIPGMPAGLTIQIVGIHISPSTGQRVYASAVVSFTVNRGEERLIA